MNPNQKDIILFDMDGTLADSAEGILNSAEHALKGFDIPVNRREMRAFIGPPLMESFTQVCGMTTRDATAAVALFREHYARSGLLGTRLYPGVEELLRALVAAGKTVALATSKTMSAARSILEAHRVLELFAAVSGAEPDGTRIDKAEVIDYALEQLGRPAPHTVVMVGDRKYDVAGAAQHGLSCIGVLYGYGDRAELEQAGAAWLADDVAGLGALLGV